MRWLVAFVLCGLLFILPGTTARAGAPQKGGDVAACHTHGACCRTHAWLPEPPRAMVVETTAIRVLGPDPQAQRSERDMDDLESRVLRLEDMIIKLVAAMEKHVAQPHQSGD